MVYLQTLAGLVFLLCGAEIMVRGSVFVAQCFRISPFIIGVTIIAFGTSAPELVVVLNAIAFESEGIALGSLIGSNIANILLVLGASALAINYRPEINVQLADIIFLSGGTIAFVLLSVNGTLSQFSGALLLGIFLIFLVRSFRQGANSEPIVDQETEVEANTTKKLLAGLAIIGGIGGVLWGANQMVDGSVTIARSLGVSEEVIGLTMVALGTSLPELATSLVAAIRGNIEMSVGNILGSNMFNLLAIGGLAAVISPMSVPDQLLQFDMWVMLGATLIIVPFFAGKLRLGRPIGFCLFTGYLTYIGLQASGIGGMLD
jgi:cation:H+ antiporter